MSILMLSPLDRATFDRLRLIYLDATESELISMALAELLYQSMRTAHQAEAERDPPDAPENSGTE